MNTSKSLEKLNCFEDLNNEAWAKIFSIYTGEKLEVPISEESIKYTKLDSNNTYFMSSVLKVTVTLINPSKSNEESKYHVIVKKPAHGQFHKFVGIFGKHFMKENFFFNFAFPNMPEISDLVAECYHGASNYDEVLFNKESYEAKCCFQGIFFISLFKKSEKGLLILDDLYMKGFKHLDKAKIVSVDQIKIVFKSLAKMHGNWWRFLNGYDTRHNMPFKKEDVFHRFHDNLPKGLGHMMKKDYKDTFNATIQLLKNRNIDPNLIERFTKYFKKTFFDKFFKLINAKNNELDSKIMTLIHGDCSINNVMFLDDKDGKPKKIKFLDFQIANISHPAYDLTFFLYLHTDHHFRQMHLTEVLTAYFYEFKKYLEGHLDISFDDFWEEFEEFRHIGLMACTQVLPHFLNPYEICLNDISDMKVMRREAAKIISNPDKPDDDPNIVELRRRLVDFVLDFDDLGLLD